MLLTSLRNVSSIYRVKTKKLPRVHKDRAYHLRTFQARYGWSDQDCAAYFGISPSMWSLIKNRKRNASPGLGLQIAEATGADFKDLIMGAK